jgi:hypothetical protein
MKAILEFSLPEENEEYELHVQASAFLAAMDDYAQWLRSVCKYGNPDDHNAESCREKFYEFIRERDLTLL